MELTALAHPGTQERPAGFDNVDDSLPSPGPRRWPIAAWGVHAFTASGVIVAMLALDALFRSAWDEVLLWQLVAVAIDGIDGTLARAAKVQERLPRIDGAAMDLIVDYLNYVLVPAMLLWRSGALPENAAVCLTMLVLLSSLYVFVRRDMKTEDGYFRGFPALWNVVAAYVVLLGLGQDISAVLVAGLAALSFAPILVIHPFRARDFGWLPPALAVAWAVSTLLAVLLPDAAIATLVSLITLAALTALGFVRTARGPRNTG